MTNRDESDETDADDDQNGWTQKLQPVRDWLTQQTSSSARERAIYGPANVDEQVNSVGVNDDFYTRVCGLLAGRRRPLLGS